MGKTQEKIINTSFDEFIKEEKKDIITGEWEKEEAKKTETIEKKFDAERLEWTQKIQNMSQTLKKVTLLKELMAEIYTERQRSIEYYHYLISLLSKVNIVYRKLYADKYEYYSFASQKRFPNETTKNNQILSEMKEIIAKKEALDNHAKFMESTGKTIDSLIYAVKYRIEIEQIERGR